MLWPHPMFFEKHNAITVANYLLNNLSRCQFSGLLYTIDKNYMHYINKILSNPRSNIKLNLSDCCYWIQANFFKNS